MEPNVIDVRASGTGQLVRVTRQVQQPNPDSGGMDIENVWEAEMLLSEWEDVFNALKEWAERAGRSFGN